MTSEEMSDVDQVDLYWIRQKINPLVALGILSTLRLLSCQETPKDRGRHTTYQ